MSKSADGKKEMLDMMFLGFKSKNDIKDNPEEYEPDELLNIYISDRSRSSILDEPTKLDPKIVFSSEYKLEPIKPKDVMILNPSEVSKNEKEIIINNHQYHGYTYFGTIQDTSLDNETYNDQAKKLMGLTKNQEMEQVD